MVYSFNFARAADVIVERGWVQGTIEDNGKVCLTGAFRYCEPQPGDWLIARAVARHRHHGEGWNDTHGRTQAEVVEWLRTAPPITDAELAEVFGPQWEQVVGLVRRATVLTSDEASRLDAAWDAARDAAWDAVRGAAWDAAWGAAWDAARDAARDAVRGAAWDAARGAAWDAARGAARGLVVRDLIGSHGFTQAHYDTLTGPWRKAIGPIHPNDPQQKEIALARN